MRILTVDIGGTAVKSAVFDEHGECVAAFDAQPTAIVDGDNAIVAQVVALCQSAQAQFALDGVAISSAGVVDPLAGTIVFAGPTIPNYGGTHWKSAIAAACQLPCTVENDVNAMALAEGWLGAAQGCHSALCLTLGTGLGGALLMDGRLWHGSTFTAGEIGYIPLPDGRRLEEGASTTALLAYYEQRCGERIDGKTLFARLRAGDVHADAALTHMIDVLADGLLPAIYVFAPERIIVGGGIAAQREIIEPRLQQTLLRRLPSARFAPKMVRCATLGNRAGMIGALRWFLDSSLSIQETS
ncbi:MAG: ROK family protein [Cardiobacteriaceae bacterium]|nr:ROK family protein [Cardiobacteriaceae bacterium]